jgi:hypothetical protein
MARVVTLCFTVGRHRAGIGKRDDVGLALSGGHMCRWAFAHRSPALTLGLVLLGTRAGSPGRSG